MPFDTLKISFPTLYISKNEDKLIKDTSKDGIESYLLKSSEKITGLNSLRIGVNNTVMEFSAKILKADYPELLIASTIEQALANIAGTGAISYDIHEILSIAQTMKAHVCVDIALPCSFKETLGLLYQLHANRSYRPTYYVGESIDFMQETTTYNNRERFKIYDKFNEYSSSKNADYRELLTKDEKQQVADYFKHHNIRLEAELNSKAKLRQYYPNIHKNIPLKELLLSNSNPILEMFNTITAPTYKQMESIPTNKSIDYLSQLTYKDQQQFHSLEKYGFDQMKINHWLKDTCTASTAQRQRKAYEKILAGYNAHHVTGNVHALLTELKAAISA